MHSSSQICSSLFLPLSYLLLTFSPLNPLHPHLPPSLFSTSPSLFFASLALYSLSHSSASLTNFSHQIRSPPSHLKKSTNVDLLVVNGVSLLTNGVFFFGGSWWICRFLWVGGGGSVHMVQRAEW